MRVEISVRDEHGFEVGNLLSMNAMEAMFTEGVSSTERKIGPLPAGDYVVAATTQDGRQAKKSVSLKGQDERKLTIRIE